MDLVDPPSESSSSPPEEKEDRCREFEELNRVKGEDVNEETGEKGNGERGMHGFLRISLRNKVARTLNLDGLLLFFLVAMIFLGWWKWEGGGVSGGSPAAATVALGVPGCDSHTKGTVPDDTP